MFLNFSSLNFEANSYENYEFIFKYIKIIYKCNFKIIGRDFVSIESKNNLKIRLLLHK